MLQIANQFMSDPEVSQAVSGMIENVGRDSMARAGQRSGQAASGPAPEGLGGLIQGLAPMMQQLMSGGSGQNSSQGASSGHHAVQGRPSQNWQDALKELDEEERADWEQTIRC